MLGAGSKDLLALHNLPAGTKNGGLVELDMVGVLPCPVGVATAEANPGRGLHFTQLGIQGRP